jgi:hypothetical protein
VRQLDAEDGGVDRVESRVAAVGNHVLVLGALAVVRDQAHARGDVVARRHDGPGVAGRAEILGRVETEAAGVADRADPPPLAGDRAPGAVRLRRVLDERRAVPAGERDEPVEVGGLAVEMDGDDGLDRPLREQRRGGVDVDRVVVADVHEQRRGAAPHDRLDGRGEREGDGEHRVAGADVERLQRELDRVRAVGDADDVRRAEVARELRLEAAISAPPTKAVRSITRAIAASISPRRLRYSAARSRTGTGMGEGRQPVSR